MSIRSDEPTPGKKKKSTATAAPTSNVSATSKSSVIGSSEAPKPSRKRPVVTDSASLKTPEEHSTAPKRFPTDDASNNSKAPEPNPTGALKAKSSIDVAAVVRSISQTELFLNAVRDWSAINPITWEGVWPSAIGPMVAAILQHHRRPLLVVVAHPVDADTLARDLDYFLGRSCELFPQASDEPDSDLDSLLQQEVVQRLQVLSKLVAYRDAVNAQLSKSDSNRSKNAAARNPVEAKDDLLNPDPPVVVTTLPALMHSVPSPDSIRSSRKLLKLKQIEPIDKLKKWLAEAGYYTTTSVQLPGEFTSRGGILDVYPPDSADPVRIEWFDQEIESIRTFDAMSQKSIERLESIALPRAKGGDQSKGSLIDYLTNDAAILLHEPTAVMYVANAFLARVPFPERFHKPEEIVSSITAKLHATFAQLATEGYLGTLHRLPIGDVQRVSGELEKLPSLVDQTLGDSRKATILCWNDGEMSRMRELLTPSIAFSKGRASLELGMLGAGFEILPDGPVVLSVNQMLKRHTLRRASRKISSRALDSFLDLKEGDLVVHLSHGIGLYRGMRMIEKFGQKQEHLEIEFAEETRLFVPISKIDLIQRYIGGSKGQPKLAKIGGQTWVRQKKAAEQAVTDMAADLLDMQAKRKSISGIAFSEDTIWQQQFDASFPYRETMDQISAIAATKADMTTTKPMDRLICGDVGFGKTEVAMRAAFKAVDSGYQVAVLVPTTVLAEQHYLTFRERMAEFPFDVARLSRFCATGEQKIILDKLAKGQIDIVIGTHRLASADVDFFNLGLVIIDEEQRFGVAVKERLKQLRPNIDLLTLSATPIPRTLHMSLIGVRDISNLETAPEERLPVETRVVRFDDMIIRNAMVRELNRGGQIYFVHNRIQDMEELAGRLQRIAPEARIVIGHGQMPEDQLEKVMQDFIDHRFDVLLSTTIIESGLDIPNANTIFIDAADRYGLAELHQLRGRVGRYKHQAYCYLLVDRNKHLNPDAARRMHAIEEYSHIGAGFGIAMRDLEIRGAGNLLGTQQSGHIAAVGYELYCQLLEKAVRKLKHEAPKLSIDVEINLPMEGFLPADYVPEMRHKIDLYRRLSRIDDVKKLEELKQELVDRFGPIPLQVKMLIEVAELRIDATLWSIKSIAIEDDFLVFTYGDKNRIEQLARRHRGVLRVLGDQKAYWPLEHQVPTETKPTPALIGPVTRSAPHSATTKGAPLAGKSAIQINPYAKPQKPSLPPSPPLSQASSRDLRNQLGANLHLSGSAQKATPALNASINLPKEPIDYIALVKSILNG